MINTDLHEAIDARLAAAKPRPIIRPSLWQRFIKFWSRRS
jgi:hypothetical protein